MLRRVVRDGASAGVKSSALDGSRITLAAAELLDDETWRMRGGLATRPVALTAPINKAPVCGNAARNV